MKGLKLAIAAAGLLGIAAMFLPYYPGARAGLWDYRSVEAIKAYVPLVGFALAALVAIVATVAGGLSRGHALAAVVGFGLAMVSGPVRFGLLGEQGIPTAIGAKILFVAAALGILLSVLGLIKPERT